MKPDDYVQELNRQLSYLVAFAREINELDMAGSLMQEFRGMQDAGWSTTITAYQVFSEMQALSTKGEPLTTAELRQILCLYAQLAEAGGVYESLSNLMGVVQLKSYNLWPFQDMVRVKSEPRRVIGPNANAVFRRLAQTASTIGMSKLSALFEMTFRDDIRNGMFHADYIIASDGLRLRRRNGGHASVVSFEELEHAMTIGLMFFDLFNQVQKEMRFSFMPARTIIGRFSANPPMQFTVECTEQGAFSMTTRSAGSQTDAAFERQERVNNLLGGRVFAAFVVDPDEATNSLLNHISENGFDVLIVSLEAQERLAELEADINIHDLWDKRFPVENHKLMLLASPFGFQRVSDIADFQKLLPTVDDLLPA